MSIAFSVFFTSRPNSSGTSLAFPDLLAKGVAYDGGFVLPWVSPTMRAHLRKAALAALPTSGRPVSSLQPFPGIEFLAKAESYLPS